MARRSGASPKRSSSIALKAVEEKLGEMADPGADLIVAGGLNVHGAAAKALDPALPFCSQRVGGKLGEEPYRVGEELGIGMRGATHFLAGHGVSGEKAGLAGAAKERMGAFGDRDFDAAYVGYQLVGF